MIQYFISLYHSRPLSKFAESPIAALVVFGIVTSWLFDHARRRFRQVSLPVLDCVVVGGGMVGSAAAFHLAKVPGFRVALVAGSDCAKSSHNDVSRMVSGSGSSSHPGYAADLQHSLAGFAAVEEESGIKFFHRSGVLHLRSTSSDKLPLREEEQLAEGAIRSLLPEVVLENEFDGSYFGVLNRANGWLDPRAFVSAHRLVAKFNGCEVVEEDAIHLERVERLGNAARWIVGTKSGRRLACRSVVLAVGAWTNLSKLLPNRQKNLDIQLWGKTVYHLEIDTKSYQKLAQMPSVLVYPNSPSTVLPDVSYVGPKASPYFYFFPPMPYDFPVSLQDEHNVTSKVKIGHSPYDPLISEVDGSDESEKLSNWMAGRGPVAERAINLSQEFFHRKLHALFPTIQWGRGVISTCVTSRTANGEVFLGPLPESPGLYICAGCNGSGAAKAHEWGRLLSVQVRCEPRSSYGNCDEHRAAS